MNKLFTILIFSCLFTLNVNGQTYAEDIAEIVYQKCANCHRDGEIGPMSFSNYDEVKSWGETIKFVTEIKYMPPWKADPSYSRFLGENYLTDEEIATIASWVDNGMERGDVNIEPAFPDFPDGSILGTPDLVLEMSEAYLHKGNNQDNYRYFVLPSGLTEDKVVKAMEFRPDNKQIVHHALIFEDTTGEAAANDAATTEYGFDGFGSFLSGNQADILNQKQYPGYVPGQKPVRYPDGTGQILQAGADVVVQLHYAPWPVDEYDQSKVNIFFADESEDIEREIEGHIMVPLQEVINDVFIIPANTKKEFHGIWTVPKDISFVGITPHMHLLGKHWEVYLERPNGEIENLILIDDWDFNWQGGFSFPRYIVAPQGSKVHAIASYDNTASNPNNPSNPPKFVTWGEGTEDEMYYLPLNYVEYREGDEDIVFDPTVSTDEPEWNNEFKIYPIYPNPVEDITTVGFSMSQGMPVDIQIMDIKGQMVRSLRKGEFFNSGNHTIHFSSKNLSNGVYILNIAGNGFQMSEKFVKQ